MQNPSSWVMGVGGQLLGDGNDHSGVSLSSIVKEGVGVRAPACAPFPGDTPLGSHQPRWTLNPPFSLTSCVTPLVSCLQPSRTLPGPPSCPQVPTPQSPPSIPTPLCQHQRAHVPALPFFLEAWMSVSRSHWTLPGLPSCEERRTSVYLSHFHFRALLPAAAHNSN